MPQQSLPVAQDAPKLLPEIASTINYSILNSPEGVAASQSPYLQLYSEHEERPSGLCLKSGDQNNLCPDTGLASPLIAYAKAIPPAVLRSQGRSRSGHIVKQLNFAW